MEFVGQGVQTREALAKKKLQTKQQKMREHLQGLEEEKKQCKYFLIALPR